MSDLNPKSNKIKLGNNEYGLRFTLNAIDDIQDHFDITIQELADLFADGKKQIANIRYILTLLINEDIDCRNDDGENIPRVTERFVGRYIDAPNIKNMTASIYGAFTNTLPESDDDSPN